MILTDLKCMLRQGKYKPAWIQALRRTKLKVLVWIFTSGDAGVRSNERADHLAGTGPIEGALQMVESEVLIALKYSVKRRASRLKGKLKME